MFSPTRLCMLAATTALTIAAATGCSDGDETVDEAEVERQTAEQLTQVVGQRPAEVDCPDDLDAEEGATMRCVVTASDGTQIGATLTVTSVEDDTAYWDVQVDDAPME